MTGAHLGGRGAGRQRGNTAEMPKSPPAKSAGVAAMVMGATTHGRSAAFFLEILIDVKVFFSLPNCAHGPDRTFLKRPYPRSSAGRSAFAVDAVGTAHEGAMFADDEDTGA